MGNWEDKEQRKYSKTTKTLKKMIGSKQEIQYKSKGAGNQFIRAICAKVQSYSYIVTRNSRCNRDRQANFDWGGSKKKVGQDIWSNSFQYLNNITSIFTYFFTNTYFQITLISKIYKQYY